MSSSDRRRWLQCAGAIGLAPFLSTCPKLSAQGGYPVRTVRIVVGFAAGGAADTFARLLANRAGASLGQSVIVDNRPGAGAAIAADHVAKSPADGHTLFLTFSEALVANTALYRKLPYNPKRDFAFISMLCASKLVVAVNKSIPVGSLKELVALARAPFTKPMNFGSWGAGSHGHLLCEALNKSYRLALQHIPYKGEGPAIQDLVAGEIQIAAGSIGAMAPHIRSGALRAVGVTGDKPSAALPQVPSLIEQGATARAFALLGWMGLVAPAGTPERVVDRWVTIVREFIESNEAQQRLLAFGFEPKLLAKDVFFRAWQADVPIWTRLISETGVTLD
ncbi:MAG: Bug family tripartite tricarboxylate transporter substrate binding protein [Burkholderiales bacterium]